MDAHVHIYMNEDGSPPHSIPFPQSSEELCGEGSGGGSITTEYCVPANEAQFYLEKFEAEGCVCAGGAECPGENCALRHNDPGEAFLEDLAGTGWLLALPSLDETEVTPNRVALSLST